MRIRDITISDSPMWTAHLVSCNQVFIQNLTIDNDLALSNTDALDIDSCQHVHISDSYFSAADDGICIKTTRKPQELQQATRHVVVSNCLIRSKSCAIKIGTETFADISHIAVHNCSIFESNRGIGLVSRDGGRFSQMIFSNILFDCRHGHPCHWGKADPVFISVRHRDPQVQPGQVEDITFSQLSGVSEGPSTCTRKHRAIFIMSPSTGCRCSSSPAPLMSRAAMTCAHRATRRAQPAWGSITPTA